MRNIVTDIGKNMTIPSNVLVFSQVLRVSVTVIVIGIVCLVSVPGQPPSNVKVLVISPYILQVSWEVGMSVCFIAIVYLNNIFQSFISFVISLVYLFKAIPAEQENGPLRGYRVLYKASDSNQDNIELPVRLDKTSANITNLNPWTFYDIWVVAYNDIGNSERSPKHSVRTLPAGM